jgi:hypothetical protein
MARRRRRIRTSDIVHELMSHLGTMAIIGPGRLTAQKNDGFRAVDALLVSIDHLAAVARIRIPRSESDVDGTWVAAAEIRADQSGARSIAAHSRRSHQRRDSGGVGDKPAHGGDSRITDHADARRDAAYRGCGHRPAPWAHPRLTPDLGARKIRRSTDVPPVGRP